MEQKTLPAVCPFVPWLPKKAYWAKWPVVACDQYTSEPEYWEALYQEVGQAPSSLHLMLPEVFLNSDDVGARVEAIHERMRSYLDQAVLEALPEGYMLVRRMCEGKQRLGLMAALDLEQYDYSEGSRSLIRATEGTIVSRIPPRLRVRQNAPLEMPHILVLIDDPRRTVIEPLFARTMSETYDVALPKGGGRIQGYHLDAQAAKGAMDALEALRDAQDGGDPLLFAVGDGNHSLATAKAHWEQIKAETPADVLEAHPARYALVEIQNLHDDGIVFEPIHRVLFGVDIMDCLGFLSKYLRERHAGAVNYMFQDENLMAEALEKSAPGAHILPYVISDASGFLRVESPSQQLEAAVLQAALDVYIAQSGAEIDYVHGDETADALGRQQGNICFFLPRLPKEALFPAVKRDGALPRKTFSMGHPHEKRFYFECRRIIP